MPDVKLSDSKTTSDLWVLEWSHSQSAIHKDRLCDSIKKNLETFYRKSPNDYVPIWVVSEEQVLSMLNIFYAAYDKPE